MIAGTEFIYSYKDLADMVEKCGFLPFFRNPIRGFSVEERTPPHLWFASDADGPWEWKGPVIRETGCAYGKFFKGKAGFISREWYSDFANYRRDGYDFDARCDEGLANYRDRTVYGVLEAHPRLLSKDWRRLSGMKDRAVFDAAVTRLQMLGYVVTSDFVYAVGKDGKPYGWGLSEFSTCEQFFGKEMIRESYGRSPEESKERMETHLRNLFTDASGREIAFITG